MGAQADWNAVDSLMQKALAAAEKVARYRHAQLSAVRLAGDINAGNNDDVTLDELLVTIKSGYRATFSAAARVLSINASTLFQCASSPRWFEALFANADAEAPFKREGPIGTDLR
jgi:hypothetical protein